MPSLPSKGKKSSSRVEWRRREQKEEKKKSSILLIFSAVFKQKVQPKKLVGAVHQHCSSCDWKLSSHLLTYLLVKIYVSIHSYKLILLLKNKMQDCPLYFQTFLLLSINEKTKKKVLKYLCMINHLSSCHIATSVCFLLAELPIGLEREVLTVPTFKKLYQTKKQLQACFKPQEYNYVHIYPSLSSKWL